MIYGSQFGPTGEYGLHEAFKVLRHLVVDVEARFLRAFKLLLVNVTVAVANHRWNAMVRQVWHLGEADKLRTQLRSTPLKSLLHGPVAPRSQEARIVHGSAVLKQLLQTVDLTDEVHECGVARISELILPASCSENVQLEVLQVDSSHLVLRLIEFIVVLHFIGQA